MKYDASTGVYEGNTDMSYHFMWTCLTDLSFWGKVEVIWRVITVKPPEDYWRIENNFRRKQKLEVLK